MVKKKKERKASIGQQKSRAKYQCPDGLLELIRQSNLVPIGVMTPDFEYETRIEIERLRKENGNESPEFSAFDFLKKLISHLPKEFLEHIEMVAHNYAFPFGENLGSERIYKQTYVSEYIEYCHMRSSMYWLVQRIKTEKDMIRDAEKSRKLPEGSVNFQHFTLLDWDAFPISIRTALKRNSDGKLHITGLAALIGKFDDSRLRRCEIETCQRIYWAKRENSKTCSAECLNKLNVRRHRALTDEEKAEKKAQREANKRFKATPKSIRKIK